jgi:potassium/chloride transporter 9
MSLEVPRNLDFLDKKAKGEKVLNGFDTVEKLETFSGVFVPTTLNVLSILMFLRFGFILGQSGILGMMGENLTMLLAGYMITELFR